MKTDERAEAGIHEDCDDFVDYNEVIQAKKLTFQDVRDHMSGPVVSLMLHVILIAVLSAWIVSKGPDESKAPLEIEYIIVKPKKIVEIPEPPLVKPPDEDVVDAPVDDPSFEAQDDPVVPNVEAINCPTPSPDIVITNLNVPLTNSAKLMPALMANRGPQGKKDAVGKHSKVPKGQVVLLKGLRWLKDHQNADGSWGDSKIANVPAYTGLALLAYLGYGAGPASQEFGPTVIKAIKKLKDFAGDDGMGVRGGYRHGIVMYALSEAYCMTKIPMLESTVTNGARRIVLGQNEKGSFNYGYNNSKMRSDLSVFGWNFQAMKAAFASGCEVEGIEDAIDKAVDMGLKKTHLVSAGGFNYGENGGATGTMTSVGTLCLQLVGEKKSREVTAGIRYLEQPRQCWFNWKGKDKRVPAWALYQWYYQTQVFFLAYEGKGSKWRKWDKMFAGELVRRQKKDGRWESPQYTFGTKDKKGGHGEGAFSGLDQPVYSTSLSCLMLEVYYRTLSTSSANVIKFSDLKSGTDDDDLGLNLQNKGEVL